MAHALGSLIFVHRNFFMTNLEDNLLVGDFSMSAKNQYNPYIEDYQGAKYLSGLRGIMKWLQNIIKVISGNSQGKEKISDVDIYNAKRIVYQLSLVAFYSWMLLPLLVKPWADDDEDDIAKQTIGYTIDAVAFDEFAEYNPLDLFSMIKTVSAVIDPIESIFDVLLLANPAKYEDNFEDTIDKGPYEDMPRYQRTLIKATPGLRGFVESKDPKTKWNYLEQ